MSANQKQVAKKSKYIPVPADEQSLKTGKGFTPYSAEPIHGAPENKHLLSALQLDAADICDYIDEAYRMKAMVDDPRRRGVPLLPFAVLKAVMRQPSTRTGGSMTTAMNKLGGVGELISGMSSSSEAKGESLADSWVALATQTDILGIRTAENGGPAFAASVIDRAVREGKLPRRVPVINLGDGQNEHITQALGDMFTTHIRFGKLEGLVAAYVGDHERYRAFHSDMILAARAGMTVIAVESPVARVPQSLIDLLGPQLVRTTDLDKTMREADELNIGRNPDEYTGDDKAEKSRSQELAAFYERSRINLRRLQQMRPDAIVKHPRPRRDELDPDVDGDPRMADVEQMANMIPMRMAIIARHMGVARLKDYVRRSSKQTPKLNIAA